MALSLAMYNFLIPFSSFAGDLYSTIGGVIMADFWLAP